MKLRYNFNNSQQALLSLDSGGKIKLKCFPMARSSSNNVITFDIYVFQHGKIICTGWNTKVPSWECKNQQQWKEAWLGLLYSYSSAMNGLSLWF
jgi:hypothetical protein